MAASMSPYRMYSKLLVLVCTLGIIVSIYAYHVETSKENDSGYVAYCDISAFISCSKAFTSRYGKGFGLVGLIVGKDHILNQPNSVFGIIFYLVQLLLDQVHTPNAARAQVGLAVASNLGSIYLASILYFVLSDFCVVCGASYLINFFVLIINLLRYSYLKRLVHSRRQKKAKSS